MTWEGFSFLSQAATNPVDPQVQLLPSQGVSSAMDQSTSNNTKGLLYAAGIVAGGIAIGYFIGYKYAMSKARINTKHQLANDKIVDTIDMEDIGEKKVFCRCWKSEKFPYCDGAHTKHNQETGDNVGPLVVKSKQ
ncbi:unnamed protein product [Cylicocyclus nassatus]|uniref:CDGSH iron-sulfur domain-containing protein 2 homologue n=1 Tax=Cylicocyclus nassatus TaxID=53992 RepID=A0AA36MEU9_CYLNA|nr:unnamed protein product [Cylicocyclus nassatus]